MADLKVTVDYSDVVGFDKAMAKAKANAAIAGYQNQRLEDTFKKMAPAINRVNKEMRAYNQMQMAATKGSNQLGVVTQQAGYQVGDFLVQIQSGTNPLVAFGQQATQLVGILPLLGPSLGMSTMALIGLSTALGIGIPLVTAIGAAFMRSREGSDNASKGIQTFEEALKKARQSSAELQAANDRLLKGFEDLAEATFAQAVELAYAKVLKAEEELDNLRKNEGGHRKRNRVLALQQAQTNLDAANAELQSYRDRQREAQKLRDAEKARADQGKAFVNALNEGQDQARAKAEQYLETVSRLEGELGQAAVDALALSNVDLASGISEAAKEAAKLAASLGVSLNAAINIMNLQGSLEYSGRGGDPRKVGSNDYTKQLGYKPVDQLIKEFESKGKGGGGKSPVEQLEKYMKKQENLVKLQTRQIGLSEEQARIEELKNKYVLAGIEPNMQRIQALAAEEEQLRKTTEAEQKRKSMMETIEGHIENAFMAMIDGSSSVEDAFKGMLRNILLEIYRQQIAKPMASGIMKLFGFANGGAFSSGRVIPFANGGVVTGPTTFPMPGATGLMGEAGPEAIMPLKRGPNGKLGVEMHGGEAPINVTNVFNLSANGDESVKKIIAQAAPQIAQMTQKQIMDSRRRGGQMKAAFS